MAKFSFPAELLEQRHLDIMHDLFSCSKFFAGKEHKGYTVQKSLFNRYDFAIIPVELISSIYENFLGEEAKKREDKPIKLTEFAESKQQQIKAYYTPPFLVDYILSQTVTPYLERQNVASCKILDPACGSGIFLVETLRKIIAKELQIRRSADTDVENTKIPNGRLWELVHENIFGIDIDVDAIEITILSLYITLLDYKTPIEIESFYFEKLKNRNLFGGKDADFFNENHNFNHKFRDEIELDFIIGNAPWGIVKDSCYDQYIVARNKKEKKEDNYTKLEIGNKEISQAFMIRVSDFIPPDRKTKCALIVSGKNLYNIRKTKVWRNYLLNKFHITQVFELSGINTKIVGGNQVFESAKQPPVIIMFRPAQNNEDTSRNQIRYITARANRFFNHFRTIVIEKHDVKNVLQKYFMECRGGHDWLWKVPLHGNVLDFHFIKRLWENFQTIEQLMTEHELISMRGLQPKFKASKEKVDTEEYSECNTVNSFYNEILAKSPPQGKKGIFRQKHNSLP